MRQFDICKLRPAQPGAAGPDLVVILQSDLLSELGNAWSPRLLRSVSCRP